MASRLDELPDVLGYVTGGVSTNVNAVQCALSVKPPKTPAGQTFEALLLVQNTLDCNVDVSVQLLVPPKDRAGKKGMFIAQTERILVGLEPAEVGVLTLPLTSSPLAAPSEKKKKGSAIRSLTGSSDAGESGYTLGVDLRVKRKGRSNTVRHSDKPVPFSPVGLDMPPESLEHLEWLKTFQYSAEQVKRGRLVAGFEVLAPAGPSLGGLDLKPDWRSLWTKRDHIDEAVVLEAVAEEAHALTSHLQREAVFKPLLQKVQFAYRNAGYPLHTGEAVFVTKLLVMVLEQGETLGPGLPVARWYVRLCRLLYAKDPALRSKERLVTDLLWRDLLTDAVTLAFNAITVVAHRPLDLFLSNVIKQKVREGDVNSVLSGFAQRLGDWLSRNEPANKPLMDFGDAYMPLVLGGLVANIRITMPGESALDSMHLFKRCRDQRANEMNDANRHIFEITDLLLDRGFDQLA